MSGGGMPLGDFFRTLRDPDGCPIPSMGPNTPNFTATRGPFQLSRETDERLHQGAGLALMGPVKEHM